GFVNLPPTAVESSVTACHAEAITEAQGPKAGTLERRPKAGAAAANQRVISIVQSAIAHVFKERCYSRKGKSESTPIWEMITCSACRLAFALKRRLPGASARALNGERETTSSRSVRRCGGRLPDGGAGPPRASSPRGRPRAPWRGY